MADQADVVKINSKKKILILAANPINTARLRFDEEVSKIKECIKRSKFRERFEIHSNLAIDPNALRRALLDNEPHIVHFIGHGEKEGIVLDDKMGFVKLTSAEKISSLFKLCMNHVECVILNACYTSSQAKTISKYIPYVIGIKKEIEDETAIEFALGFYDALGAGKSVKEAFEFGCNAVLDLPQELIPVLEKKKEFEKQVNTTGTIKPVEAVLHNSIPPKKPEIPGKNGISKLFLIFLVPLVIFGVLFLLYLLIPENDGQSGTIEKVKNEGKILIEKKTEGSIKNGERFPIEEKPNIFEELKDKGLIKKLREASGFCDSGNFENENKALTLYREVVRELSPRLRKTLSSTLLKMLNEAENDFRNKHYIHAMLKYKTLFDKIINNSGAERSPYRHQASRNIGYLKAADRSGAPDIDFDSKGNKVSLTSKKWNTSGFWIKFKNPLINWDEYDQIYLKVDYSEKTEFDQSAMLKLQLNGTTLSPVNEKTIQSGAKKEDLYLIKSKGNFCYQLKSNDLDQDNEILITLNKGKWLNFCIELALIKQ